MSASSSAVAGLGRPIKGPSALGSDPRRLIRLTWALAVTDFKLRFFGSVLGYVWQLVRPLMLFGVLYFVFSEFLSLGGDVQYYPVSLLLGLVLYGFLAEATSQSVRALMLRENLVRRIEFPRLAVPMATVLTACFNLALNFVPVVVFLLAAGGRPEWSWLELPFVIAFLVLFAFGLAMLLSALFPRYRDIEPIWDVVMQVMFYASPIFYTLQTVAEKASPTAAKIIVCNPFAAALQAARHVFIDPSHLSPSQVLGSAWLLLIPIGITVSVVVVGYVVFSREAPRMAEDL